MQCLSTILVIMYCFVQHVDFGPFQDHMVGLAFSYVVNSVWMFGFFVLIKLQNYDSASN
jgi:hypothetical protein